jgi:hypothetical protein
MTSLANILKRAMALMKAHVQYSQNLAVEFSDLIKDYEKLVETPEDIVIKAQEEVDLEAVCNVFEELMENEPIAVLRALIPFLDENAETAGIKHEAVEQSHENAEESVENELISDEPPVKLFNFDAVEPRSIIQNCVSSGDKEVHSKIKQFECSLCDKKFNRKNYLRVHIRNHTGVKQFECSVCNKKFNRRNYLREHIRNHTGVKPFECSVCSWRFTTNNKLKRHTKIHIIKE